MLIDQKSLCKKRAFTLLELSISLIVISTMVAGVIMGSGLIASSKLSLARSLTAGSPVPEIEGLVAWYETSSFDSFDEAEASNDATITSWYDISPRSIPSQKNTLVAKTGVVSYVRDGINGVPSLQFGDFDNVSNLDLAAFDQGTSSQNTIFAVIRPADKDEDVNRDYFFMDSSDGQGKTSLGLTDLVPGYLILNTGTQDETTKTVNNVPTFTLDHPYIVAVYIDGTLSKGYVNQADMRVGDDNFGFDLENLGDNLLTGLTIGSRKDNENADRFVGLISEIIIYDRPLRSKERENVFIYLSKKYNIPLTGT